MSKFIGRLADIGVKIETTRGTAESTATFWLPKMSFTYDDKIDQAVDESSVGVIEDAVDAKIVGKYADGEFEGNIGDRSIGVLLKAALGTVSTTGPTETSVYVHTFTVQEDAQCDSLTIMQDDANQDYSYPLGMIDSFALDVMLKEFAKVTVGFRSKPGSTASHSPSYTVENRFLPQHGTFKYADAQSGLGAGTEINIKSFQLTINKNVEDDMKLGSVSAVDILNKQMSAEGSLELVFDAETLKTFMLADTAKAIRIQLANTDVTLQSGGSLNPKLIIDLHKVKFSNFTRNYSNDDIVTATVDFKGFYSTTDSAMITVALTNTQASY